MTRKIIKRIFSVLLIFTLVFTALSVGFSVSADEVSDTKAEIEELEQQSEALEAELKKLKAQKADQQKIRDALQKQVNNTQAEIDACNSLIVKYRNEIAESEAQITQQQNEIADTKERFKKRIRSMQLNNSTNNVQLILGAESFSDFLVLSELSKSMTIQDQILIDKIVATIADIEKQIAANNERRAAQDEIKKTLDAKKAELDVQVAEINGVIAGIQKDESGLNSDIDNIEAQIQQKESYLDSLISGGSVHSGPFDGNFSWPVPGHYYISAYWQSNDSVHKGNHKGIDIAGGSISGKPVIASASGTVAKVYNGCSHNWGKSYSCGCGGGYGNNVRIDHGKYQGNDYLTIYAHLKSSASGISVGSYVSGGTTIGYVGSTGWSTGYHLHFGIAQNGSWVNPYPYVQ